MLTSSPHRKHSFQPVILEESAE